MSPLDFGLVFLFGLVSSLHCVQMCGPLVLSYSLPLAKNGAGRRDLILAHAGYNAGRILTYGALGAAAGALGGAAGMLGRMAGMANGARIFAGIAMLAAGISLLGFRPSTGLVSIDRKSFTLLLSRAVSRLLLAPGPGRKFQLGLVLGFLPCGLVYGALLKAVDSGSALTGAMTMLAFGLGTALSLLGIGLASGFLGKFTGNWSNRLAAASLLVFGLFLLWRGLVPPAGPTCHVHS